MTVHSTQDRDDGDDSLSVATCFYFFGENRSGFLPAMRASQLVEAMLFDVKLNRGNLDDLMAIGVGVESFQFLSTTGAGGGIVVGYAIILFYWIQGTAMTGVSGLPASLFSRWLFFLSLLEVRGIGGGRAMGVV
jgi:hypothetical protein